MKQGDGHGGWVLRRAEIQFLHCGDGKTPYYDSKGQGLIPFGVAQMDNGEVALVGSVHNPQIEKWPQSEKPVIAFSQDGGRSWSKIKLIDESEECFGRPVMLTYLGQGRLMFQSQTEPSTVYLSCDYGRTWSERWPLPKASNGLEFGVEGNPLTDQDSRGVVTKIAQFGANYTNMAEWPMASANAFIRWSRDSGRTWTNEVSPSGWRWQASYEGRSYTRSVNEGSLIRAANGWIVAALRTEMLPQFFPARLDNLDGIGFSISKDDGKTWSPIKEIFVAGRMHPHLLRMPDGVLVMTYIMRQDVQDGRLASYRRGCGALISRDNGLTWDVSRQYLLDEFEFADGTPYAIGCGHVYSTLLNDAHILTCYGHYISKGAALIRWTPTT